MYYMYVRKYIHTYIHTYMELCPSDMEYIGYYGFDTIHYRTTVCYDWKHSIPGSGRLPRGRIVDAIVAPTH